MSGSRLFTPLKVGHMELKHRVVMAPLTRNRANDDFVPLMERAGVYYGQRASVPGTLLITEATPISMQAIGYPNLPGIFTDEQVEAWRPIVEGVHRKGSYIFLQLWHMGRAVEPSLAAKLGTKVVSASEIAIDDKHAKPAAMTEAEIEATIGDYATGAANAIRAGFDGVEIHAANGYLIDQFLQDVSNERTDGWGGSVEKRSRFTVEVARAVVAAVGNDANKVGIRFSPYSSFQSMGMRDPKPQFTHVLRELRKLHLAYIHLVESRISGNAEVETTESIDFAVDAWDGESPVLLAGGFTPDSGLRAANEEYKDRNVAIVYGRHFISNPDLPYRIEKGIALTKYDRNTFYALKEVKGYIDYPFSDEFTKEFPARL